MAGPYRERIFGVALKIQPTPGTDAVPTGANALRIVGIASLKWDYMEPGTRDDVVTGQLGLTERTDAAGRWGSLDVVLEAKGAGAAYATGTVEPEADVLLRIAGLTRTFTVGAGTESVLYTTADAGFEIASCYCWSAGKLFKLIDCVATLKLSAEAAKRGFWNATITGLMRADPSEVALPALTFSSVKPPLFHTSVATIGTWSSAAGSDPLVLKSMTADLQNTVVDRPSAGATDGHAGYLIADRKARLEMEVEVPAIATFDPFALSKATGSALPLVVAQIGQVQYNRVKIQTGRWQLERPEIGANKSINTAKLAGGLVIGAAPTSNREINFLFD